jgi:uncharacterized membrane protein
LTDDRGGSTPLDLDHAIARLLTLGTYASVALLAVGVLLMLARRISPLGGPPSFEPSLLLDDLVSFRPAAYIWLGLVAVVATPAARVVASLVGYVRRRERSMAIVAVLILVVIALSVALAVGLEA